MLVCASAVGYYGSRGDQILTEASAAGSDFLARVVMDWEEAANWPNRSEFAWSAFDSAWCWDTAARSPRLLPLFRFGVGGTLGSGHQWMAWIHIDDAVSLILFALNLRRHSRRRECHRAASGDQRRIHRAAWRMRCIGRPFSPCPLLRLKLALGEMSEVLLASQRVLPTVAKSAGFRFQYPELQPALENLLVVSYRCPARPERQ